MFKVRIITRPEYVEPVVFLYRIADVDNLSLFLSLSIRNLYVKSLKCFPYQEGIILIIKHESYFHLVTKYEKKCFNFNCQTNYILLR